MAIMSTVDTILTHLPSPYVRCNISSINDSYQFNVTFANDLWQRVFGKVLNLDKINSLIDLAPDLQLSDTLLSNYLAKVIEPGSAVTFDHFTSQIQRWYQVTIIRIAEDQIALILNDITRDLREVSNKSDILKQLYSFVLDIDELFIIERVYKADASMLLFAIDDPITHPVNEAFSEPFGTQLVEALLRAKATREKQFVVIPVSRTDQIKWWSLECEYFQSGRITKYFVAATDVTAEKLKDEAISNAELKFKSYTMNAPIGLIVINQRLEILQTNNAVEKIFNIKSHLLMMQSFNQLIIHTERDHLVDSISRLEIGQTHEVDIQTSHSMNVQWIHIVCSRMTNSLWLVYIEDITSRKENEVKLVQQEKYMEHILQTTHDAFWVINEFAQIIDCNLAATKMTHYARERLIGQPISKIDASLTNLNMNEALLYLKEHQSWRFESIHLCADQSQIEVEVIATLLEYPQPSILAFVRDISDRKKSEREVLTQKELLKTTLNAISEGVITTDKTGVIIWMNPIALKYSVVLPELSIGYPIDNSFMLVNDRGEDLSSDIIERISKGSSWKFDECVNLISNSISHPINGELVPLFDGQNNRIGSVFAFHDVTELRQKMKQIEYLTMHDSLTGLYNRKYQDDALNRLNTSRNYPFTIMSLDIVNLKNTNDLKGVDFGDHVILRVAEGLKLMLRADDIIARMGDDEFEILLPHTNEEQSTAIQERIQKYFNSIGEPVAIGFATKHHDSEDIYAIRRQAEDKMYANKSR